MRELTIYRGENATEIATVSIDEKTIYVHKVMEVETIEAHFTVPAAIPIQIGDYVVFDTKKFYLNLLPTIVKKNIKTNVYTAYFHGVLYDLNNKLFISSDGLSEFSEIGTVSLFLTLIVNQMNQIGTGWQVGTVEDSADILIDFVNENCLQALNKVATEFQFEYELVGKTINFKKVIGTPRDLTFEYGKNKGLYDIERKQVDSKAVYTRVYGYGGTKNINYDYRNRARRLVFEERLLEKNTDIFGIREINFTDDTIYPQRTATLTNCNIAFASDNFNAQDSWLEDTSLDFDINDFLLKEQTAKIVFKSGDLQGVEFEIWKVNFITKRIYISPFQDTDNYVLPSIAKQPRIGDRYTLVDLKMPPSYVIQAELDLKNATQVFLDANCVPKTLYLVKVDPKFTKANNIVLKAGDLVKVIDVTLGVNRAIRIQELKYPLVNRNKINAFIADFIPYELQDYANKTALKTGKIFQALNTQLKEIRTLQKNSTTASNTNIYTTGASIKTITVNNKEFGFAKAFDNINNTDVLEIGDVIYGNFWARNLYVNGWVYIGGIKEQLNSWQIPSSNLEISDFKEEFTWHTDDALTHTFYFEPVQVMYVFLIRNSITKIIQLPDYKIVPPKTIALNFPLEDNDKIICHYKHITDITVLNN